MVIAYAGILGLTVAAGLLGWAYFRHYRITRPPLGTVNLGDVAFMVGGIVLVPYLYLGLPALLVGALLAVSTFSAIGTVLEPVVHRGATAWGIAPGLVAADITLALWSGTASRPFLLVNDLVLLLVLVGVTNLRAQGGLSARDLALLAGAIAVYDAVATGWLPLTTELIERLAGLPFLPMLAWPTGDGQWLGIGLGDLLLATVGPLTLRKAYGRTAGLVAVAVAVGAVAAVMALATWGDLVRAFPTMIVLGPLMVAQVLFWSRRLGPERMTAGYLLAETTAPAPAGMVRG